MSSSWSNKHIICKILIILLVSKGADAIISGSSQADSNSSGELAKNLTISSEDVGQLPQQDHKSNRESAEAAPNVNTTFYYDPNAFLINKKDTSNSEVSKEEQFQVKPPNEKSTKVSYANLSMPEPASPSMTSGRSGRMLDLDALMGDFAAAQANRDRNSRISGNRQSRFLNQAQQGHTLDVGGGKKLHIQGFIPIVGVKDVSQEGDSERDNLNEAQSESFSSGSKQQQQQQRPKFNDLPYEQSSAGHASYGVQRYLNSVDQGKAHQMMMQSSNPHNQQVEAKYNSGGSMFDSLKKPLKRLTDFGASESQQQQNCLCVPFYMCKNGFISEASLGKAQIQQMIGQQQQIAAIKQQSADQIEMKSGQLITSAPQLMQIQQPQTQQPQYADSYVQVDERSLDRELVTMSSLVGGTGFLNSETGSPSSNHSNSDSSSYSGGDGNKLDGSSDSGPNQASVNLTTLDQSSSGGQDYSQEILGRMLGLKSSSGQHQYQHSSKSSGNGAAAQASLSGVCGLLRSCCQIPTNLLPSQQDMANERFMAQYGSTGMSKYQQQLMAATKQQQQQPLFAQSTELVPQQVMAVQRYQQSQNSAGASNRVPYGFPARSQQIPMQPLNTPMIDVSSMTHRSNQFNPNQLLSQYTRAASPMQQLQSFQNQQLHNQQYNNQLQAATRNSIASIPQPMNSGANLIKNQLATSGLLGTRKILEGRCGIRQSAGITGRVQALQYHESSADFGEYPAQAAILKRLGGSESLFVCGGTLISQYWVATAAHCIKKHSQSDLKIRLGEWDVHRDDEFYPFVEKEVRDLIIHPEFVAGNLVNDIALLRLDSPVDPSLPHVNPACLPALDESFSRQRCWVTGWGKDSFGQKGSFQAVLHEVELPVLGQAECEQSLRQTRLGPHYRLHPGFICAGGEGGRDACEGDGGSGLYCHQDGITKVAGLVSWGIGCGQAGVPGVYVSMAHYRPWIENIISIDEDIYSPDSNMIGSSLISERNSANNTTAVEASTEIPKV